MTIDIYYDYTVHAKQTLVLDQGYQGFIFQHLDYSDLNLINFGNIQVQGQSGSNIVGIEDDGYDYGGRDIIWNKASGQMSVTSAADGANATGIDIAGNPCVFVNDGAFSVSAAISALGGQITNGSELHNNGEITVTGDGSAIGFSLTRSALLDNAGRIDVDGSSAIGLEISDTTTFENSGALVVTSTDFPGVGVSFDYVQNFDNSGQIVVKGEGSVGLSLTTQYWGADDIRNSGLIKAETAILSQDGYYGGGSTTVDNSGKILGALTFGSTDDTVLNTGVIKGDISLGAGDDLFSGAGGRSSGIIDGGDGDDKLFGGRGSQELHGGDGHDLLVGGKGADILDGGGGADTFAFLRTADSTVAHSDLIDDLGGSDRIDLSAIDADTTHSGDQAFTLVAALDGHAGELALSYVAAEDVTLLQADVDGDGVADMSIRLAGDQTSFTNFVL